MGQLCLVVTTTTVAPTVVTVVHEHQSMMLQPTGQDDDESHGTRASMPVSSTNFLLEGKMKKTPPIIEIEWEDARTDHGWHDEEDIKTGLALVYDVGFLLDRSKKSITIADRFTRTEAGDSFGCHHVIPRVCIKKVRYLRR